MTSEGDDIRCPTPAPRDPQAAIKLDTQAALEHRDPQALLKDSRSVAARTSPPATVEAPNLIDILADTLREVQESLKLNPDDPALKNLKTSILRRIADLQMQRSSRPIS